MYSSDYYILLIYDNAQHQEKIIKTNADADDTRGSLKISWKSDRDKESVDPRAIHLAIH